MHPEWRLEVAELLVARRYSEALTLVRQAIEQGNMSARVMLAKMGENAGLVRDEVDRLIDEVETTMAPADVETHLELSSAYDRRLGNLPYLEKDERCFDHLLKAVEQGAGPIHVLALARKYVMGTLSVRPNFEEAIRWYKHAVQQGSVEAVDELQRLYQHIQRQRRHEPNA
ncbi:sel1 repeat family protein [Bradyrhizobium daqingense]|uniref:Sel1 repeat-containing protein n=1 Tax=Bradyrhizobium daqingense TaxID=993502 RepID=A0A562LG70_9BRAD|nr:sel1 repeat family protein [Bradyrhizobium daqingense]TWI06601.1 hypothetical protein IQ17_02816 [Bradyrhizobium daqingense]UFS86486.1 sel1 repeat family protein [Bradyrhizobium daqingense]